MALMFSTFPVLSVDKFKSLKELQSENIRYIFLTLLVFKPVKSKLVNALQYSNILVISITLLVFNLSSPSIYCNEPKK